MKLVTFGDRRLFLGNEAADALTAYTAVLASRHAADTVTLNVIGPDGHAVAATLVLNQGVTLIAETADETFIEPDNSSAIDYMREQAGARERRESNTLTHEEASEYRDFFGEI